MSGLDKGSVKREGDCRMERERQVAELKGLMACKECCWWLLEKVEREKIVSE